MSEAKQMHTKLKSDIQALTQDNDSWKRKITENEHKIAELQKIVEVLEPLCKEVEQ
jgi:predicted  nucleic acid-binding Zn-ribbon protein